MEIFWVKMRVVLSGSNSTMETVSNSFVTPHFSTLWRFFFFAVGLRCRPLIWRIFDIFFSIQINDGWKLNYIFTRVWDRFLEQTPFWILPWGCPLFQVRHTQFEFPAIFGWKLQKGSLLQSPELELGTFRLWALALYLKTNEDLMIKECNFV